MMISERKREPLHYLLKIEFFSLLSEARTSKIESDVFEASGHKWRLDLYPKGNKEETDGDDHISLYLVICDTQSLAKGWEVFVDVNIFVYNHNSHNYASFRGADGNGIRFHEKKMEWGFDKLISMKSFKDSNNGYLCNDSCVFGAEVFNVSAYTKKDRCLSFIKPPAAMNTYTWTINNFSAITDKVLNSEVFKVGKFNWKVKVYPKGRNSGEGTHLAIYLHVHNADSFPAGWRLYAQFTLRVKNQRGTLHVERESCHFFYDKNDVWGYPRLMPLSELNCPKKGFLLNDNLIVEAEMTLLGTFKNFF